MKAECGGWVAWNVGGYGIGKGDGVFDADGMRRAGQRRVHNDRDEKKEGRRC